MYYLCCHRIIITRLSRPQQKWTRTTTKKQQKKNIPKFFLSSFLFSFFFISFAFDPNKRNRERTEIITYVIVCLCLAHNVFDIRRIYIVHYCISGAIYTHYVKGMSCGVLFSGQYSNPLCASTLRRKKFFAL